MDMHTAPPLWPQRRCKIAQRQSLSRLGTYVQEKRNNKKKVETVQRTTQTHTTPLGTILPTIVLPTRSHGTVAR